MGSDLQRVARDFFGTIGVSTYHETTALTAANIPRTLATFPQAPSATPLAVLEPGVPWSRYLAAIWRRKWLVAACTAAGIVGGVVALRIARPTYDVRATLWIGSRNGSGDARSMELVNGSSWVDLLRSYAILEPAVRRAGLLAVPTREADQPLFDSFTILDRSVIGRFTLRVSGAANKYTLLDSTQKIVETGAIGDSIGRALGFVWQPPVDALRNGSYEFTVRTPRDAANDVALRLTTVQPEGTSFIRLTLRGKDPRATAALLNMITDEFIGVSTDLKKRSVVSQSSRLREQSEAAEKSLRDAEAELQRFRVASVTLPTDAGFASRANGADPLLSKYMDARTELESLQRDRATITDAMRRLAADENATDYVLALPAVSSRAPELRTAVLALDTKDTAIMTARQKYTDEHKTVRELRQSANQLRLEVIPRLAAARIAEMNRRERELQSTIGAAEQVLQSIPPRTIDELRLRRNVDLAENLFTKVQNEYESARLAAAGMVADVSVLDPAIAPEHGPKGRAIQLMALFTTGGIFSGLFFALLLDATDKRLRYQEQVREVLDLWVLGSLPRLPKKAKGHTIENAQLVEALRAIRVGMAYALGGKMPMQVTITSPNVGDGKSLTAANLAISFAEAGYSTLLVDGDIRLGELHTMFNVPRRPGLLDCLATGVSLSESALPTEVANLWILPCGTRYRQGPEMLAGPRFAGLMNDAKASYDVVLVDAPPLGLGSDVLWECVATGAAVIVLRMDASDLKLAKAKLEVLDRLPVEILGAVLNDCPTPGPDEHSHYLAPELVDLDTAIPQQASRIGLITTGESHS